MGRFYPSQNAMHLLSRACFLLGFTIVKLNKNKMKNIPLKFGLQHRKGK